jgi:hypothetical protein
MHSMFLSASNKGPGWRKDRILALLGHNVIKAAGRRFPEARPGDMALSLILRRGKDTFGYSHRGDHLGYPASLVKPFFMVATEAWLAKGRLTPSRELREAVAAMIAWSSNDASSLIVDLLTRTTSGPACHRPPWRAGWPAAASSTGISRLAPAGIRRHQSRPEDWYGAPYGREHQSLRRARNRTASAPMRSPGCCGLAKAGRQPAPSRAMPG